MFEPKRCNISTSLKHIRKWWILAIQTWIYIMGKLFWYISLIIFQKIGRIYGYIHLFSRAISYVSSPGIDRKPRYDTRGFRPFSSVVFVHKLLKRVVQMKLASIWKVTSVGLAGLNFHWVVIEYKRAHASTVGRQIRSFVIGCREWYTIPTANHTLTRLIRSAVIGCREWHTIPTANQNRWRVWMLDSSKSGTQHLWC